MIEVLMERDGMCADEAQEYLEFNYVGGYVGPSTPFVLYRLPMEELEHE
jgi:hypothetical protein